MALAQNKIRAELRVVVVLAALCGLLTMQVPTPAIGQTQPPENDRGRRMVRDELEKASDKLFNEARRSFDQGNYWGCARDLIIQMDFNPDYSRTDEVVFTLGDCLYELGLQDGASRLYKHLLRKYIRSPFLPNALLGLQRLEYDKKSYARCLEFYSAISRGNPTEQILDASEYYAGLSYYKLKDYPTAIQLLTRISEKSPYYDYGLYTIGQSMLRMKSVRKAVETFKSVCRLPVASNERRNVIDDAHLTLGYLYYELGYYKQAWGQFRAVSVSHEHYADALLAAGWAAAKLENYAEAITPLTNLISRFSENEANDEASFLLGRCYLKLSLYDQALKVYEYLISVSPDRDVIPAILREVNQSLAVESTKIEKIRMELLMLESKLLDLLPISESNNLPSSIKDEKIRLAEVRSALLRRIQEERQTFDTLSAQMSQLRNMASLKEDHRDWKAYAEYGKSRALFLKQMQ
jgi:tetratricopeptide (TPR) repeat protein